MGNLIGLCACNCIGLICNNLCSNQCNKCSFGARGVWGRLVYAIVLLMMAVISFLLRNLPNWLDSSEYVAWIPGFHGCSPQNTSNWRSTVEKLINTPDITVPEQLCYGTMSVYRVSFAMAVFHLLLTLIMINVHLKSDPRNQLQHSWWTMKILALVAIAVGSFFIPNAFYLYYSWIALFCSAIFILIQLILLVDFAHSWTESWVGNYEKTQSKCWAGALLGATAGLYVVSLALTVLMYIYFLGNTNQCWYNPMFVTLNVVFCFFISVISVNPKLQEKNPRIGLLQAAVVTAYSTYLVWSALSSQPASMGCSSFPIGQPGQSQDALSISLGVIFTFLAVIYSALRVSSSSETLSNKEEKLQRKKLLATLAHEDELEERKDEKRENKKEQNSEDKKDEGKVDLESSEETKSEKDEIVSYNYSFFHFTFLLASMYLAMVLTNWQSVDYITGQGISENTIVVDQGMTAVWVKVVSSWITLLLFIWTLVAPIVLPNRKFWD